MSYVKLFNVCSDFALGIQTLNQAIDNNKALLDQFDLRHRVDRGSSVFPPGKHDDPLIARSVADYYVSTSNGVTTAAPFFAGQFISAAPVRIGVGQWRIYLYTRTIVSAIATVKEPWGDFPYHATVSIGSYNSVNFCHVNTWALGVPPADETPTATDLSFSLAVYAESWA